MLSYIKYGMNLCYEGFGYGSDWDSDCAIGNSPFNDGKSTYSPGATFSVKDVVDDLATLLTSGRLSKESRLIIQQRYLDTFEYGKSQLEAIINVQQLIATSPEFHTNGLFRKTGKPRFQPADPTATGKPYKAVIYVMLPGGMDSFNMLAPHTCSGTNAAGKNLRDQYDEERGVLAFNGNQGERRLTIQASNQPCEEFAIHDELEIVKDLYDDGDLVFFANAGVINRHGMTKLNFNDLTKTQLFAHNKMQEELKKVDPFDLSLGTGVLGRAKDVLTRKGHVVNSLSIDESTIALEGTPSISIESVVVGRKGAKKFALRPRDENYFDIEKYALELNAESDEHSNIHADSWSKEFAAGMRDGSSIVDYLRFTQLTQSIWYTNGNQPKQNNAVQKEHWEKWSTLFKLLQTRKDRKADRDIFFTAFEGWDHHDRMKINLRDRFQGLNHGIKMFTNQLKVEGIWDQVTIVVVSDFGRTLTPNSNEGSDHAWSGHYFMMGGSVKGGQILGDYPDDITDDGPLNIGRGRIMPTLSWDAIWHGVIQWMGVEDQADLDICLPNAANTVASTSSLFSRNDLFYEDSMARHLRGPRK